MLEVYSNLAKCDEFVGLSQSEAYFVTLNQRWCFLPLFWPLKVRQSQFVPQCSHRLSLRPCPPNALQPQAQSPVSILDVCKPRHIVHIVAVSLLVSVLAVATVML